MRTSRIKVAIVLHFYQPEWQDPKILEKIIRECYRPLLIWLNQQDHFCFTINVNWSLIELLINYGHRDILNMIKLAITDGRVELTGTAAYHPIMPLLSADENMRQIEYDARMKLENDIPAHTSDGFYLPEYAYSHDLTKPLVRAGYRWTVSDDCMYGMAHSEKVPIDYIPVVNGLYVFQRSRQWGKFISEMFYERDGIRHNVDFDTMNRFFPSDIRSWWNASGKSDGYVVLATDVETFGHHHPNRIEWLLIPMIEQWAKEDSSVEIVPFARLIQLFGKVRTEEDFVPPGSWSTEKGDFVSNVFYPLWNHPDNVYHRMLWSLLAVARKYGGDESVAVDVMKSLSSCAEWWVSARPYFDPNLMLFSARKALDIVDQVGTDADKAEAHRIFNEIMSQPVFVRNG